MEKRDIGLWMLDKEMEGGKYIVLRRDGTVFSEPNFVLGPRDPAAPAAMRAYADECQKLMDSGNTNFNQQYIDECRNLASMMEQHQAIYGLGDPGKGPHRKDHPKVIEQMLNPQKQILAPKEE